MPPGDGSMKEKVQNQHKYMELLNINDEKQAVHEIRNLASNLSEHEHLIRSCIFDLHAAVEFELKRMLFWSFKHLLFITDDKGRNNRIKINYEKMIDRLNFMDVWRILKPVIIEWYSSFESIEKINITRNQAAHGNIDKVNYQGRNPFRDTDCFCQMYFDVWAIKQEIPKVFERMMLPHYKNRAYYEKYGDISVSKDIIDKIHSWYNEN